MQEHKNLNYNEMIKKKENIIARKIHGSYFLIDISDNYAGDKCALYEINETGMFLWEHIDGKRTIKDLSTALKNAIIDDVDFQMIYEDTVDFIGTLIDRNFIEG